MALKRSQHTNQAAVEEEFVNIDENKEPLITFGNRVPTSAENGRFFVNQKSATTADLYVRHQTSGNWIKISP